ncbi:VOC family protein [Luteitalea sp.]|jgi:catechol 2,3-dioxygenase-like lactoylglutathione lyase family enzyme|uniref:VOC family protein n=1 Tax=Luteitalea sp. TaxID=2004800 RepID=UPI0025C2DF16|nr:VOC family protein [Luteitalea sp.]
MPGPLTAAPLGQIALTVHDIDAAVTFYRDVLGLALLFQAPPSLAFFRAGDVRLMLTLPEDGPGPAGTASVLYFTVAGIVEVEAALRQGGATFEKGAHCVAVMPDHELWMAFFRDPSGNLLGLMEEKRPVSPS